ncbi:MAG: hypothetical protein HUU16_13840 [Candidatus Omnitrophica bacterium]|nr:hypothetical protein [Candidatus Omnitrophota bacterium]
MRITVDLDENTLSKLQEVTGIKKKSPAVTHAVEQYLRSVRVEEVIRKAVNGETDYSTTNEELEAMPFDDLDRLIGLDRLPPTRGSRQCLGNGRHLTQGGSRGVCMSDLL